MVTTDRTSTKHARAIRRRNRANHGDTFYGFLFISPWIVGFLVLTAGPMVASLLLAFTRYDFLRPLKWVGFQNFVHMFTKDYYFWNSLWVTAKWVLFREPIMILIGLVVALLLNRGLRVIGLFRMLFYLPSVIAGTVATAVMWKMLLGKDGQLNTFLAFFGVPSVSWFQSPRYAFWTLALTSFIGFGGEMMIFLAGLKNIPPSLYEAAVIDGARPSQQFFRITIPMLSPVLFFVMVMGTISAFQYFTSAFVITQGGPLAKTMFYMINLYRNAFQYSKAGYASSLAWVLFWIIVLVTLAIFRTSNLWVFYETEVRAKKVSRKAG
ncbi:MAG TPA: sugar ABC transporter permease [Spirochaetia bacterium]|nr:sugar ABC transporter permease [Spirochaetia bacterium]